MPDFQRVQSPPFTPTACLACSTHHDHNGFVDLLVDQPVAGRAYLCANCVYMAGRQLGCLDAEQSADLTARLAASVAEITALKQQLEQERANKVVSIADVRAMLQQPANPVIVSAPDAPVKRGPGRPPKEPVPTDAA